MKIMAFLIPFAAFGVGIYWLYKLSRPKLMKGTYVVMLDDLILQIDEVEYDKVQRELTLSCAIESLNCRDLVRLKTTFSRQNPNIPNLEIICSEHVMVYPYPALSFIVSKNKRTLLTFKSHQELEFLPNLELAAY